MNNVSKTWKTEHVIVFLSGENPHNSLLFLSDRRFAIEDNFMPEIIENILCLIVDITDNYKQMTFNIIL